jgi:pimeloyl-ACP methyl ester carboxylesterase
MMDRRQMLTAVGMGGAGIALAGAASAQTPQTPASGYTDDGAARWPTAIFASKSDPRFSWCKYVPPSFAKDPKAHRLAVLVHGSGRNQWEYRAAFQDFARFNKYVLLAPLFPANVRGDGYADGYKYMREDDIRYDHVLLNMVAEVSALLSHDFGKFALFGYSGGGHFAHRFLYLQPDQLRAVSIGAPGGITLIDSTTDYWAGTRNFNDIFGQSIDVAAIRRVAIQIVIGANDIEEFTYPGGSALQAIHAKLGKNRFERSMTLLKNYQSLGCDVRREVVPNCAHDGLKVMPAAQDFFLRTI